MLNTQLIAEFQAIAREGRTGALSVVTGQDKRRFYFEDGQLMLMDLCTDKELLLARTFADFHKIDEAMHQLACQLYRQSGTKVAETLEKQRVVHGEESAYVQRSMVEQVLVKLFSTPHDQLQWLPDDEEIEPFDLDVSALKIKIDTNMLVTMAQTRIQERDAVAGAIADFGSVVGLTEVDAGGMQLNEMEQNVLRMVDGHKSIRDLARSMRDSTQNIATYIKSLMNHGLVKLMGDTSTASSRIMPPFDQQAGAQMAEAPPQQQTADVPSQQAGAQGAAPQESFPVYTESIARQRGGGGGGRLLLTMLLLAGLVLAAGIGFLVWQSQQTKTTIDSLRYKLAQDIDENQWSQAEQHVASAFEVAGNDVVLRDSLQQVCELYRQVIAQRLDKIERRIEEGQLDVAAARIDAFPSALPADSLIWNEELTTSLVDLRTTLENQRELMARERQVLIDTVDLLLNSGDVRGAVNTIAAIENDDLREEFLRHLATWRQARLADVQQAERMNISARLRTLERIERAQPTDEELATITALREDMQKAIDRARRRLADAREALQRGDIAAVERQLQSIRQQMRNETFLGDMADIRQQLQGLERRRDEARRRLRAAVANEMRASGLEGVVDDVRDAFADHPKLLASTGLQQDLTMVEEVAALAALPTLKEERQAIDRLLTEGDIDEQMIPMLQRRQEAIAETAQQARDALEEARNLLRARRARPAKERYQAIIDQVVWQRSEVVGIAKQEIGDAEALIAEQEEDKQQLYQAMRDNDIVTVRTIAGRLGMDSLPLYLRSEPSGAQVLLDGALIGETPLLIKELDNPERAEATFSFDLPGYQRRSIDALDARAGWLIELTLERSAVATTTLDQRLTAEPAAIAGRLWLAGGRGIFAVSAASGEARHYWMGLDEPTALPRLENPVYAAPIMSDGAVQVTTRDRLVLAVDAESGTVDRRGIPDETNLPVSTFHSELIVDRVLDIIVDLDHDLQAYDRRSASVVWHFDAAVPVVGKPVIDGRMLMIAYQDGRLVTLDADNGDLLAERQLDDMIGAAWAGDDGAVHGVAGSSLWRWDGEELRRRELPFQAINGGPGIALTNENRVHIVDDEGNWQLVGVNRNELIGPPVRWGEHAVLVSQHQVEVIGPRPFTISSAADMLLPTVVDDKLAVTSSDGVVRFFAP